jgi:hypothetical protein
MDFILRAAGWWVTQVTTAFTVHTLGAAVLTIAAIGVLIVLIKEYRPFGVLINAGIVLLAWLVAITLLPLAMTRGASAVATLDTTLPIAYRFAGYLYGIYERHPLMVLVIVGVGTTAFFLRQSWPFRLSWWPVRAVCTLLGVAFLVHIAAPIADLIEPPPAVAAPVAAPVVPKIPAREAAAAAIKAGDLRYLSVPQCVEQAVGAPAEASANAKRIGLSCDDTLGSEGIARVHAQREYAAEYNRLIGESLAAQAPKAPEVNAEAKVEAK